jgi:hypothetical protein
LFELDCLQDLLTATLSAELALLDCTLLRVIKHKELRSTSCTLEHLNLCQHDSYFSFNNAVNHGILCHAFILAPGKTNGSAYSWQGQLLA